MQRGLRKGGVPQARSTPGLAPAWALPDGWGEALHDELSKPAMHELRQFVDEERQRGPVYPPEEDLFTAFRLTPIDTVRVVILGQDPYHGAGQAHGLAFSVREGAPLPPSLANIFRELTSDLGVPPPRSGSLVPWAKRGVLLLNTVLTVRANEPHSHRGRGWEQLTDAVIQALVARPEPKVFVLWGKAAQTKARLLEGSPHAVVRGPHPSPLSAHSGFLGSRPFSTVNRLLRERGAPPVDFSLPSA